MAESGTRAGLQVLQNSGTHATELTDIQEWIINCWPILQLSLSLQGFQEADCLKKSVNQKSKLTPANYGCNQFKFMKMIVSNLQILVHHHLKRLYSSTRIWADSLFFLQVFEFRGQWMINIEPSNKHCFGLCDLSFLSQSWLGLRLFWFIVSSTTVPVNLHR